MSAIASAVPTLLDAVAPPEFRGLARDEVRLLASDRARGTHEHVRFTELPRLLRAGDLLVVNDSATLPAALTAVRADGATLALHVATRIDERLWIVEPRGAVSAGETLRLPLGASAVPLAPVDAERPRVWYVAFTLPIEMESYLAEVGEPIRYGYVHERFPLTAYQTIFARVPGSAEMPSAGRAFTTRIVDAAHARGVGIASITLHCGVASFEAPEQPAPERYAVSPRAADTVNRVRRSGGRVIAVGTTVVRALESSVHEGVVVASAGWTDLVVDASHAPRAVDGLLTGFHDASATHQWMLQAFAPPHFLADAYTHAVEHGYRRHEFGDLHLIV